MGFRAIPRVEKQKAKSSLSWFRGFNNFLEKKWSSTKNQIPVCKNCDKNRQKIPFYETLEEVILELSKDTQFKTNEASKLQSKSKEISQIKEQNKELMNRLRTELINLN